jgi:Rrf2 family protein
MLVTTTEGYALKALIYIASKKDRRATIREISDVNKISFPYILRICASLRAHGILESVRGRNGGYILKKDPAEISLYDIIQAVGRQTVEIRCEYGKRKDLSCYQPHCISEIAWLFVKFKTDELFKNIKLKDLLPRRKESKNAVNKHSSH